MTDLAIRVEGLSKRYRIGQRERDNALRDVITDVFAAPFRRLHENSQSAIRNVFPAAYCLVAHVSRFTFHGCCLSALGAPCPRVPVSPRRRLPSPVSCQRSALRNPPFEIRNVSPAAYCLLPSALSSPHVSRFIFHVPRSLAVSRFTFHVSFFTFHDSLPCPSVPQKE